VLGLFDGETLRADWRIATRSPRTADELGALLAALFAAEKLDPSAVEGVIVSSVVPDWNPILAATARKTFASKRCSSRRVSRRTSHPLRETRTRSGPTAS
jgi:pantothenate kinase type III